MKRRLFMQGSLAFLGASPLMASFRENRFESAVDVLRSATDSLQVKAAVMTVLHRGETFSQAFGEASTDGAMFLLGSISKPIAVMALMTQYDQGRFDLDDKVQRYLPAFRGDGRERVTMRHLLTHVSGLPDQLPENGELRKKHATLDDFVEHAIRTPLSFAPGTQYQYSSMAILLASRVAELLSGTDIHSLVDDTVFGPLKMTRSAQGLGRFELTDMVPCQTELAAPESGGGDPAAKAWDWNSLYWRRLGAPWGGAHASAPDIARFLSELLEARGEAVKPDTARLMVRNHNSPGLKARGLGLDVGSSAGSIGCSGKSFGHTGSTGTISWADPETNAICVVLTSLPARAVQPHPRDTAANQVAAAVRV